MQLKLLCKATATAVLLWLCMGSLMAQQVMSPELLYQVKRISVKGLSKDGQNWVVSITQPDIEANKNQSKHYLLSLANGGLTPIVNPAEHLAPTHSSPDGLVEVIHKKVKLKKVSGADFYPQFPQANMLVYDDLHHRHWDAWRDGEYNHPIVLLKENGKVKQEIDLLANLPYDCPTLPFGDASDYALSPDGKKVIYVCKKLAGTDYVRSTNTDIFEYTIATGTTRNLSENMQGYDVHPSFTGSGAIAWLSMARDGFEADKNDLIVWDNGIIQNLTKNWDGSVKDYIWSQDGRKIYFIAPVAGTVQLFEVNYPGKTKLAPVVRQITNGDFDVASLCGIAQNQLWVLRTSMNRAAELYAVNTATGEMTKRSSINDELYSNIKTSNIEKRLVPTTDGKQMTVWVVYPPDFDAQKKYPALLYCQGGPQSALTQFYSFRWNFQLLAAQGYIVVAPNRRGMPGHGVEWNEQISKDWGGQVMRDYLSAIDDMAKEPYVDKQRLGAIGASYGGYSVFFLAGIHQKRFKTFVAHAGVYNLQSMYGATEEVFFTDWDFGGPYWEKNNAQAHKTYQEFNPMLKVQNWDTPILITHGGKDYRVPENQGFEAFQSARLRGIKSRLVYLPDENHWILKPQNAIAWQFEILRWLKETL